MRARTILAAGVVALAAFGGRASAGGEEAFWKWFVANEPRLFHFEEDRETIFRELGSRMRRVHPSLTFEFGPVEDGKRELVLSADGDRSAFPAVEALFTRAPSLERWTWVKFRPRRLPIGDLRLEGRTVRARDVRFLLAKDGDRVDITLFFEDYREEEKATFAQLGFLFLDAALGEYAVETRVGLVDFRSQESESFPRALPLAELPRSFDDHFAQQAP